MVFANDIVVIGGGGHVGLPLSIVLADRGHRTVIYDVDQHAVDTVLSGRLPFREPGAEPLLRKALDDGMLHATTEASAVASAGTVIVVIGTPVDEHLNPDPNAITRALAACIEHFRDGQLVVLRSTLYPGVTAFVERFFADAGLSVDVAFCPERIAEHKAMEELVSLPQIVASRTESGRQRAAALFGTLTAKIVDLTPEEAELAKLFTNTWRYIKFAAANQFYMMANDRGLDFERIRQGLREDYPRAADLPGAGFAAGPCLLKDTMQLAAFSDNNFSLGHSAMLVNEGLPLYLVTQLEKQGDLTGKTVGILGMAFKAESDDIRSSLAYKLRRVLRFKAREVIATDPYVSADTDPTLLPLDEVLERADVLIIAAPHRAYAALSPTTRVIDIWNLLGDGVRA
jgi:UDP-N-acetyl-D-mannosaminuronic acid dehydrogenase